MNPNPTPEQMKTYLTFANAQEIAYGASEAMKRAPAMDAQAFCRFVSKTLLSPNEVLEHIAPERRPAFADIAAEARALIESGSCIVPEVIKLKSIQRWAVEKIEEKGGE